MKIKLVINNQLEEDNQLYYEKYDPDLKNFVAVRKIESYNEEKWKNGSVYEFNTLKEMGEFIDSCDIDFTEEFADGFDNYEWWEIDIDYYIDPSEDNLMVLCIGCHIEWRD